MYNLFQFCIICLGHADAKAATSAALAIGAGLERIFIINKL